MKLAMFVRHCGTAALLCAFAPHAGAGDERVNPFNDPFIEITHGHPHCAEPRPPSLTVKQMESEAHARVERGTRCYQDGRCRLPNSYQYDKEIIPRVKKAVLSAGSFADTTVYALGQRRWVFLQGCVRTRGQSQAIEKLARGVEDVEQVINQLAVVNR
jgi:BON domain